MAGGGGRDEKDKIKEQKSLPEEFVRRKGNVGGGG